MPTVETYLALITSRAEWLALVVVVAYLCGAFFARGPFLAALRAGDAFMASMARKLDRKNRTIPILVYRGIIAVLILIIPAFGMGILMSVEQPWVQTLGLLLLLIWFGHCFQTLPTITIWRKAKDEQLGLQIPNLDFLFPDSHAVLRHVIATRLDAFATGIVGASFWYVVGGWVPTGVYLTLAAAASTYHPHLAFGWAARGLFAMMDALPRLVARALMFFAALVTPHTKPFAGLMAKNWRLSVATMLDISLSGAIIDGKASWVGNGTARLTHLHLRRTLHLLFAATVWLTLLLTSPMIYKILIKFM